MTLLSHSHRKLIVAFGSLLVSASTTFSASKQYFVAPNGDDANLGSIRQPFRSVMKARDAVRLFRETHPGFADSVIVFLRSGRFYLQEPLEFGPEDGGTDASPTVYACFPGEHPAVSGGVQVSGWREGEFEGRPVLVAPLPRLSDSMLTVRQLWINGIRRSPARMPNTGYMLVDSVPEASAKTDWQDGQRSFVARTGDIDRASNLHGAEVVVLDRWVESHLPVQSFDPGQNLLVFSRRSVFRLEKGDPYYIIGARSAFDTTGEWYVDSDQGLLYYFPEASERASTLDAVIPVQTNLLLVNGSAASGRYVEHLHFRGIEFSHTEWHFPAGETDARHSDAGGFVQAATGVPAAIEWDAARFCSLERCTLSHLGTYGIAFGEGCRYNRIAGCDLYDLGAGGLKIGMKMIAPDSLTRTSDNLVINNHIHDGGKIFQSAIGIWIGQSPRNHIIHNHIHDFYYSGISIGWTWGYGPANAAGNIVALNHIHHIGILSDGDGPILSDMGGIYTLGNHRGTVVRQNVFHDIAARVYGGWGIYLDEGTSGLRAENNVVYRTTHGGFHQHYGRENIVRNNIFAFGRDQQIQRSRAENHTSFAFENNIVIWDEGKLFQGNLLEGDAVLDWNLYWPMNGTFQVDSMNFRQWQRAGFDQHSVVADPLFETPAAGSFRLRKGSPAFALGFQPIDVSTALSPVPITEPLSEKTRTVRRLLYNNDGSNILMAYDTLTPRRAYERIDPLAHTGITTFLHNVNPGQNPGYPSSIAPMYHWNPPAGTSKEGWGTLGMNMSNNLARLTREGIDPVALIMDRARLRGMESMLTFRMNELHDVDKPESPLLSPFWKSHPEYRVGGYEGWGKDALNYAIPEVRDYFYALLKEVVSRYDLDGLELDFMRFPYYFPLHADSMNLYAGIMTRFVERVRAMTDSIGNARGRAILLSARIPTSLKGCEHIGLDPARWSAEKLVDFLTLAPFLSTETDIPVGEFKAVCGSLPIYTCLEFTIGSRQMTREEKRAAAALLYAAGSDGMYLFNYFVAWDAGLQADTDILCELADPDSLIGKDKLYTIAAPHYPVPGVSLPGQVPLQLKKGERQSVTVRTHEPKRPRAVILRIECSNSVSTSDMLLRLNGTNLRPGSIPEDPQMFPQRIWSSHPVREHTLEFAADPTLLKEENEVTIQINRPVTVEWVYLEVKY